MYTYLYAIIGSNPTSLPPPLEEGKRTAERVRNTYNCRKKKNNNNNNITYISERSSTLQERKRK